MSTSIRTGVLTILCVTGLAFAAAPLTRAADAPAKPAAAPAAAAPAAAATPPNPANGAAPAKAKSDTKGNGSDAGDVNLGFDSSKPIDVNADTFAADLKNNIGTYTGNVIVIQGMLKMHADQVVVNAPKGKATHMEAHGHVVIVSPSGTATGENGIYEVGDRVMHLMGNVVLTKEQSVMRGEQADMEVATGQSHLIAAATKGPDGQTKPGRVQGLFIPADKPEDAAKPAADAPKSTPKP
jgi:lipopolysaccharide export system protein LptA